MLHLYFVFPIEDLHNVTSIYTCMTLPCSLVSFLYSVVWRKTTKHTVILDLLHNRILNFTRVYVLIFLSLSCSLVLWYELMKSSETFCCVFQYQTVGRGNQHGGQSRIWWLAKLAWYDITWKPSIHNLTFSFLSLILYTSPCYIWFFFSSFKILSNAYLHVYFSICFFWMHLLVQHSIWKYV